MRSWFQVLTTTDTRAGRTWHLQDLRHFVVEDVRRSQMMTTGREDHHAQRTSDKAVREVRQQIVNRLFCLVQSILHAPVDQRQIRFMTAFIVVTFQNRRGEEHLAQDITQTRGDTLATLQAAAQNGHRHVRQQRQVRAQAV
ncbi:hypothetical protein D3C76_1349990 [compost metagenome]